MELVGQESRITPGLTVLEQVLEGCGAKRDLLLRFTALSDAIAAAPDDEALLAELGDLSQRMDEEEAWSLEQQCREVLQKLGISDLKRPVEDLSGGYRKRVGLASALVACPDVLLLDEPTNHLDAAAVEWLQSWLDRYPGALVLVTHDRYVLDRVTKRMVEVDQGLARTYQGNYSTYLQHKAEEDASEAASAAKFKEFSAGSWLGYARAPRPEAPNRRPACNASKRCGMKNHSSPRKTGDGKREPPHRQDGDRSRGGWRHRRW